MTDSSKLEKARQWIVVVFFSFAASLFWGVAFTLLLKYLAGIDDEDTLLWISLAAALVICAFIFPLIWRRARGKY